MRLVHVHRGRGWQLPLLLFPFPTGLLLTPESWTLPLMGVIAGHYCYQVELLEMEQSRLTSLTLTWPRCPTALCLEALARNLQSHPDHTFAAYVVQGLHEGFHIGYSYQPCRPRSCGHNHPSSLANVATTHDHINTELAAH